MKLGKHWVFLSKICNSLLKRKVSMIRVNVTDTLFINLGMLELYYGVKIYS